MESRSEAPARLGFTRSRRTAKSAAQCTAPPFAHTNNGASPTLDLELDKD